MSSKHPLYRDVSRRTEVTVVQIDIRTDVEVRRIGAKRIPTLVREAAPDFAREIIQRRALRLANIASTSDPPAYSPNISSMMAGSSKTTVIAGRKANAAMAANPTSSAQFPPPGRCKDASR
jgi:hypothetical protein